MARLDSRDPPAISANNTKHAQLTRHTGCFFRLAALAPPACNFLTQCSGPLGNVSHHNPLHLLLQPMTAKPNPPHLSVGQPLRIVAICDFTLMALKQRMSKQAVAGLLLCTTEFGPPAKLY